MNCDSNIPVQLVARDNQSGDHSETIAPAVMHAVCFRDSSKVSHAESQEKLSQSVLCDQVQNRGDSFGRHRRWIKL